MDNNTQLYKIDIITQCMDLKDIFDITRFIAKTRINKETGCWEWQKCLNQGYSVFDYNGRHDSGHRFSYEYFYQTKIPRGMVIDHLCRNPKCVNPKHLELVTYRENTNRGLSPKKLSEMTIKRCKAITHCPQGHPYDDKNTYYSPKGHRSCRICRKNAEQRNRDRKKLHICEHNSCYLNGKYNINNHFYCGIHTKYHTSESPVIISPS